MTALLRQLASFLANPLGSNSRSAVSFADANRRLTNLLDEREHERGMRTTAIPSAIAGKRADLERAERALAEAVSGGSYFEFLLAVLMGVLTLVTDAALSFAPAANRAGIVLSDLGTLTAAEWADLLAFPALVTAFNLCVSLLSAYLVVLRRPGLACLGAFVLILGDAFISLLRVGQIDNAGDLVEFAFFGLVPPAVALSFALLCALHGTRTEARRRISRAVRLHRAKLGELEAEERRAWAERTQIASVLDGTSLDDVPFMPATGRSLPPATTMTVTAVMVVLGVAAFLFAGCATTEPTADTPFALGVLLDTSESVRLDFGQAAADVIRAAEAAGELRGGAEIMIAATAPEGEVVLVERVTMPRRFTPGGNALEEREQFLTGLHDRLESRVWSKGDSTVIGGLLMLGEVLAPVSATRKVVVLVSDCRDHRRKEHFFGRQVPDPEELVSRLEAAAALPSLVGVDVVACGVGIHKNEDGTRFTEQNKAEVVKAMTAVVERGGGTFRTAPSCAVADLTRAINAHHKGEEP